MVVGCFYIRLLSELRLIIIQFIIALMIRRYLY